MGMAAAIPAMIAGGASVGSSLVARKTAKDISSQARELTPEERASHTAATGVADRLGGLGEVLYGRGMGTLSGPQSYYETLMGKGGRGAMQSAVAPAAENIAAGHEGMGRALKGRYVRGGTRDLALAESERQKTGAISRLTAGVQPMAASALESLGRYQTGAGMGATQGAGDIYSRLTGHGLQSRQLGYQGAVQGNRIGTQSGENIGSLMFSLLRSGQGKGGGGGNVPNRQAGGGGFQMTPVGMG